MLTILLYESLVAEAWVVLKIWTGGFWSPRPLTSQGSQKKKKKKRLNTGPKEGGCDGCAHFPHRLQRSTFFTSVHLFVDQLFKTKGINTIFIRIHWMCSKIENTVKELTSPLTLSTKYILTFLWKYKKGNLVIAYKAFFPFLRLLLFVLNGQVCFGGLLVPIKQMCSSPFSFRLAISQPITRGGSRILWCLKDPEGIHFSFFCVAFCLRII